MPLRLIKFALSKEYPEPRMFRERDRLKSSYDAVIIGAGGHGLAAAYYLARDYGMNNIVVLERGYIGGGNTGRNTTIIRSNYLTPEGVKFYDESVRLWQDLAQDFDLHQKTEVTGITIKSGRVTEVQTNRGNIATSKVLCAVAGFTPRILEMVGLRSPLYIHPLQAMVSEPMKAWLDPIIVSGSLHVYVSQTARGELVMDASLDPYELHSTRSTLDFVEGLAARMLDLFPFLSHVKVVRQWAGMADMTPDFAPIMGKTPIEGFYLDSGWGTWGFKATPVCGKTMAYTVANDCNHELIKDFSLSRFADYELVGEKGAASVGH
jgi:glycine/D-amino acid oxidase-like deaminating enzyme